MGSFDHFFQGFGVFYLDKRQDGIFKTTYGADVDVDFLVDVEMSQFNNVRHLLFRFSNAFWHSEVQMYSMLLLSNGRNGADDSANAGRYMWRLCIDPMNDLS